MILPWKGDIMAMLLEAGGYPDTPNNDGAPVWYII